MTEDKLPSDDDTEQAASQVRLEGEGPFLLPFLGSDVSFGFGDDVAVMRMMTQEGQEILLPFAKETLRAIGLALSDTLKEAFREGRGDARHEAFVSDDLTFEKRDE